jgi:hypothetical protein
MLGVNNRLLSFFRLLPNAFRSTSKSQGSPPGWRPEVGIKPAVNSNYAPRTLKTRPHLNPGPTVRHQHQQNAARLCALRKSKEVNKSQSNFVQFDPLE